MNDSKPLCGSRYDWLRKGDVNAFFGLMLDNLTGLFLLFLLLSLKFGFPGDFIVSAMVPGTALGVLIGDLAFVYFAFRLSRRTGRSDVTAMPLGLDTPSVFGVTLLILGPAYAHGVNVMELDPTAAAYRAWHIGIWCTVLSGCVKLVMAPMTQWVRRVVPRAGLLGSLAAIALVLISYLPLSEIFAHPLPGLLALVIVLTTLIARVPLPGNMPGTLGALLIAGLAYYLMCGAGVPGYHFPEVPTIQWFPTRWLESWNFAWVASLDDALPYFPIALPFAIATVVGGIDCTESAAAAGDDYDTRTVIGVEAVATLIAGLSGGVIQTTPYIGHPAYKAMGGRAGYTLGTALLIGSAGLIGYFAWINALIPKPVVMPILVFVGLEITAQSFFATPRRHYAAVAFACLPALAYLALILTNQVINEDAVRDAGMTVQSFSPVLQDTYHTTTMLSNGFILVSLFWAWALAAAIDRRLGVSAAVLAACAGLTLLGLIHSPLDGNQMFLPFGPQQWEHLVLPIEHRAKVFEFAAAYAVTAVTLLAWGKVAPPLNELVDTEH
ncbi:permease family protein [Stieleria varia]|uniref:Permease n=1 Tax=Stieleria varia TaxID=2528005 RepID=A0A5C6B2K8_9BACT|nr:permease [Stieleria varia]TWU05659.1 hypothetical protein Pla52n_13740 [Stieleria varia]